LGAFDKIMSEVERIGFIERLINEQFSKKQLPQLDLSEFNEDFRFLVTNLTQDGIKALKTAELLKNIVTELPDYSHQSSLNIAKLLKLNYTINF
jgi:hypothetical protein